MWVGEEAQGEVDEQSRGRRGLARTGTDATPLSLSLGGWETKGFQFCTKVIGQQEEKEGQKFPRRMDFPVSTEAGRPGSDAWTGRNARQVTNEQ